MQRNNRAIEAPVQDDGQTTDLTSERCTVDFVVPACDVPLVSNVHRPTQVTPRRSGHFDCARRGRYFASGIRLGRGPYSVPIPAYESSICKHTPRATNMRPASTGAAPPSRFAKNNAAGRTNREITDIGVDHVAVPGVRGAARLRNHPAGYQ